MNISYPLPEGFLPDPLLLEAEQISAKKGFVSISHLQRMLRIGYPRAARLVDLMIAEGFCEGKYESNTFTHLIIERTRPELVVRFHEHLDKCEQCEQNPFNLCKVGQFLILSTTQPYFL